MSRFVAEPHEIVNAGEGPPPTTAGGLLNHLGVAHAPKRVQRAAVARWLERNEPDRLMLRTLRTLDLIDEHRSSRAA